MKSFDQMIRQALHLQSTILEMQIKSALQGKQALMDRLNILERQVDFNMVPPEAFEKALGDTGDPR